MNMRRILKTPTLRMNAGGSYGSDATAAFVAANPPKPAAPTAWGGENRGSLQRGGEAPGPAPAMAPAAPPILRDGNSFGDAASLRQGSAPAAPMNNLQQYTADAVAARGAGMQATSGDWARTTAYTPPGVSPMPAATGAPAAAKAPTPYQDQLAKSSAASATAAAGALDRQSALRERIAAAPSNFTPMAMPTIGMKHGGSYKDGIGGVVPGKPRGDIYAANYEGGETVVSNHVQEDNPGLKEQLASLREESLARRGMTPEQADAKAVSGPTLRAVMGYGEPNANATRPQRAPVMPAGVQLPNATELDLRNNVMPQKMPAASVAADALAGARNDTKIDATRANTVQRMTVPQGIPAAELETRRMGTLATATTSPGATPMAKSNLIDFNTAPDKPGLQATTSRGAAGPTISQMNQPGVDLRNAQFAERAAYEAEQARAANPRSMTVKELFSRGVDSGPAKNPMKFAPPVPQSAANAAANAAVHAAPVAEAAADVAPKGMLQKGLAGAQSMLGSAADSRLGKLAIGAANSPVGKFVGKVGGVGGQAMLHSGEAGAPTLDAERVAAMSRPYDPDWRPGDKLPQLRDNAVASGFQTITPVTPNAKLGDTREVDEYAGTMEVFTKGRGDKAGWTTVSTPGAKAERALRDQQFQAQRRQDFDDATTGPNGWKTRDAERQAREDAAKPMYINARKAFNEKRGQDMTLRAAMAQNETSRANNAATNQTSLRGHELDFEGKMAPIRQAARMREMKANVMAQAGGDLGTAAKIWASQGGDPKDFLDAQAAQNTARASDQTNAEAKAKQGRDMFAGKYFRLNTKGEEVEDLPARDAAYNAYLNSTDGKALSEEDRLANEADAHRHGKMVRGARQKAQDRNNSWNPFLTAQPLPTDVSPSLRPEKVGFFEGMMMPHGVKRGDHSLGDGYLPDDIDEDVIKYQLRRNAAFDAQQQKGK